MADVEQTYVSCIEKNMTQKENADFSSTSSKGSSETLLTNYQNGVQQKLIPSTLEKKVIKRIGSKLTRHLRGIFIF